MTHELIVPKIFNRNVRAFFTRKSLGSDTVKIAGFLSITKDDIYLPIQKHTDQIMVLRSDTNQRVADAVITQRRGALIGVQVADCVPVLLFDKGKSVVGAVHAGWRGTASQIIKKTIRSMIEIFGSDPKEIMVALGPSIRWNCYEVGSDVKEAVCKATGEGLYCIRKEEKYCIDLASANIIQAASSGISRGNIWSSGECTYCNPNAFYSYRYLKTYAGSQGGFIGVF